MKRESAIEYRSGSLLWILAAIMLLLRNTGYAQSDYEKLKEIKLSGKYYFSEAGSKDTTGLMQQARRKLLDKISRMYLDNPGVADKRDSSLHIGVVKSWVMPHGMTFRAIAYVDTLDVFMHRQAGVPELRIIPIVQERERTGVPVQEREERRPVIARLQQFREADALLDFLSRQQRKAKLAFVAKESLVQHPPECYVIVLDYAKNKVIALLDKGAEQRTDLISGDTIPNFKTKYSKQAFIWLYVY